MTREEAFRYCLENPDNLSPEQLLNKFPTYSGELQSLLAIDRELTRSLPQAMAAASRAALKERVVASAAPGAVEGNSSTKGVAKPPLREQHRQRGAGVLRTRRWQGIFRSRRVAGLLAAAVALFMVLWYFSSIALPDSPFYGVKLATESTLLNYTDGPEGLVTGHIQLANMRLRDLRAMQSAGKLERAQPALDSYASHLRGGVAVWKGLSGDVHNRLDKLLYLSSVAGENAFQGFDSIMDRLPAGMQSDIADILLDVRELNITAGSELEALGVDLRQVLKEADATWSALLTPVPGAAPPASTPAPIPTSIASAGSNPAARVPDPHSAGIIYFPPSGHTLRGAFRDYWQQHGGLRQFGYPLTEEYPEVSRTDGKTYIVQYFERARFEHHPESKPPFDVLLGLLGSEIAGGRAGLAPFKPTPAQAAPGGLYFPETHHNVSPQFTTYWRTHDGLQLYGYPVSEAFNEVSPTDGKTYLVQYFERNRFELHPDLPEAFQVSLGLLGREALQARGLIP